MNYEQIRIARRAQKLSLGDLSRDLKISVPTLSAIEKGNANPTMKTLEAIAVKLGGRIVFVRG